MILSRFLKSFEVIRGQRFKMADFICSRPINMCKTRERSDQRKEPPAGLLGGISRLRVVANILIFMIGSSQKAQECSRIIKIIAKVPVITQNKNIANSIGFLLLLSY